MQRKHIISLCILLCVLAVVAAFRPSADETVPLTGSASAGLILLDGQSEGFYVLAVIDQSRADRAGIEAGDTLLTLNSQPPAVSLSRPMRQDWQAKMLWEQVLPLPSPCDKAASRHRD